MTTNDIHNRLSQHMLADGMPLVYDLEKSHDNYFVDARDGREYLDLFSFFASGALGHNHEVFFEGQVVKELANAARTKPSLSDIYTKTMAEFVEEVASITPKEMTQHFFVEGGALAVENALKAAFDWKMRKNIAAGKGEKGSKILHFEQAFHGRSGYTMSLTNTQSLEKVQYFPKFDWPRVPAPCIDFSLTENFDEAMAAKEEACLEKIKQCFEEHKDDIAAILIEPIQGEGGDRHFRKEFFEALKEISVKEDVLLIFDEVQTGLGITGKWWCHEHYGVSPDLLVFGKKMQVGGFCSTDRINEVDSVFKVSSRINSTFGGNLCDMVRGKWIIKTIKEEKLVEKAAEMGSKLLTSINDLAKEAGSISQVRGKGLMVAFDLPSSEERDQLCTDALKEGVMLLACGETSIRFRPHLVFDDASLEFLMGTLKKLLCGQQAAG